MRGSRHGRASLLKKDAPLTVAPDVMDALLSDTGGSEEMMGRFIRPVEPSSLDEGDFERNADDLDIIERVLGHALENSSSGVNIMLLGSRTASRTEFPRVVAQRLGCTLHEVVDKEDPYERLSSLQRFQAYQLGQKMLEKKPGSIMFFELFYDILSDDSI